MAKDPFEQFAIPPEMRAFAEQSVAQARKAVDGFIEATNKAVGQMQGHAQAAHSSAAEIAHKSMTYAEQNVAATFDFAQKLLTRQGCGGGDGPAVAISQPPDAGAVDPGPGSRPKCRQDRGRGGQAEIQAVNLAACWRRSSKITIFSNICLSLCIAIISVAMHQKNCYLSFWKCPGLDIDNSRRSAAGSRHVRQRATGGEAKSKKVLRERDSPRATSKTKEKCHGGSHTPPPPRK